MHLSYDYISVLKGSYSYIAALPLGFNYPEVPKLTIWSNANKQCKLPFNFTNFLKVLQLSYSYLVTMDVTVLQHCNLATVILQHCNLKTATLHYCDFCKVIFQYRNLVIVILLPPNCRTATWS